MSKPAKIPKSHDFQKVARFMEELTWLLNTYKDVSLSGALQVLKKQDKQAQFVDDAVGRFRSPNPNKHFLVGVLPRLLSSVEVFSSNEEIAQFAAAALSIKIPRYHKKSRFEIIGHIVCAVDGLDESGLATLVKALSSAFKDNSRYAKLIERKKANFEWNVIIQELSEAE